MSRGRTRERSWKQKYLERLSDLYPTIAAASTEIINLQAILNLPKGTEHFLTDIHGEWEAFAHVLEEWFGFGQEKNRRRIWKYIEFERQAVAGYFDLLSKSQDGTGEKTDRSIWKTGIRSSCTV